MISRLSKVLKWNIDASNLVKFQFSSVHATKSAVPSPLKLLYPFNKLETQKVLDSIKDHQDDLSQSNTRHLIKLDKLTSTSYSETHRMFNQDKKVFLAEKIINLDSPNSWNQANLILRQYYFEKPWLSQIISLDYDQAQKQMKIYSRIEKTTLEDFSQFRTRNPTVWSNDVLKVFLWQLLNQLNILRKLGATSDDLKLENLYIDKEASLIKLFDLADFKSDAVIDASDVISMGTMPANLNKAIHALVKVISPFAPVSNSREARNYLKEKYPDFMKDLRDIEDEVRLLSSWWNTNQEEKMKEKMKLNMFARPIFIDKKYDIFLAQKLIKTLQAQNPDSFTKNWEAVKQSLEGVNEIPNDKLNERILNFQESPSQSYTSNYESASREAKSGVANRNKKTAQFSNSFKVLLSVAAISCILVISEIYYLKSDFTNGGLFGRTKTKEEIDEDAAFLLEIFSDLNEIKCKIINKLTEMEK